MLTKQQFWLLVEYVFSSVKILKKRDVKANLIPFFKDENGKNQKIKIIRSDNKREHYYFQKNWKN